MSCKQVLQAQAKVREALKEEDKQKGDTREKKRKGDGAPETTGSKALKTDKTQACQDAIFAPENASKLDAASVLDSDVSCFSL